VLAQPGPPAATTGASPVAGTVVIVTPGQPIMAPDQPVAPAPMPVPMVATVAPQNEDWNNVSHINGQVVKVGERGDYLYDNGKTTNIASNPIGWMFGFYGVSVSHAIHPNVAIRGDVNVFRIGNDTGHELGISLPIYFRRAFQGPFLEPGVVHRNFNDDCSDCTSETVGPEMLFGWHWSFDSGLNVAVAIGAVRSMGQRDNAEPAGYFRIGYAM
jgi:hypothetical protein